MMDIEKIITASTDINKAADSGTKEEYGRGY